MASGFWEVLFYIIIVFSRKIITAINYTSYMSLRQWATMASPEFYDCYIVDYKSQENTQDSGTGIN